MSEPTPTHWTAHTAVRASPLAVYDAAKNNWGITGDTASEERVLMGVNTSTAVFPVPAAEDPGAETAAVAPGRETVTITNDGASVRAYGVFTHPSQSNAHTLVLSPVLSGSIVASGPNLLVAAQRLVDDTGVEHYRIHGFNGMNCYTRAVTYIGGVKLHLQPLPEPVRVHANIGVAAVRTLAKQPSDHLIGFRANPGETGAYVLPGTLGPDDRVVLDASVALVWLRGRAIHALAAAGGTWATLDGFSTQDGDLLLTGANLALVVQPGRGLVHAFSGIETTGAKPFTWTTEPASGVTVCSVSGNVALISVPGRGEVLAYSAVTGTWARLDAPRAPAEIVPGEAELVPGKDAVAFLPSGGTTAAPPAAAVLQAATA